MSTLSPTAHPVLTINFLQLVSQLQNQLLILLSNLPQTNQNLLKVTSFVTIPINIIGLMEHAVGRIAEIKKQVIGTMPHSLASLVVVRFFVNRQKTKNQNLWRCGSSADHKNTSKLKPISSCNSSSKLKLPHTNLHYAIAKGDSGTSNHYFFTKDANSLLNVHPDPHGPPTVTFPNKACI